VAYREFSQKLDPVGLTIFIKKSNPVNLLLWGIEAATKGIMVLHAKQAIINFLSLRRPDLNSEPTND
jgi:hypothetical protein